MITNCSVFDFYQIYLTNSDLEIMNRFLEKNRKMRSFFKVWFMEDHYVNIFCLKSFGLRLIRNSAITLIESS